MSRWRTRPLFFEGFDNDHGCTAGGADVGGCWSIIVNGICCWDGIEAVLAEEFTQSLQVFNPGVVGEEPVVTDAVEA